LTRARKGRFEELMGVYLLFLQNKFRLGDDNLRVGKTLSPNGSVS
jgi:hypothetical protein